MREWLGSHVLQWGRRFVDKGELDRAGVAVKVLRRLRYTGEFELAASIALKQGDFGRAVEILRKPADQHPQVWLLNSYLGEAFSNQGAYEAARERFERVYEVAGPAGSGLYNLGVVAQREGNSEEALRLLERSVVEGEPMSPELVAQARGYALMKLDRLTEAEAEFRKSESPKAKASIALVLALQGREAEAWEAVAESFRIEPGFSEACEATRVLLGERQTPISRTYRVLLDGLLDPDRHPLGKRWGFFATAWINADDEAEALSIARRIEPDLLELRIDECTWEAVGEDARRGYLARAKGHTLYKNVSGWPGRG